MERIRQIHPQIRQVPVATRTTAIMEGTVIILTIPPWRTPAMQLVLQTLLATILRMETMTTQITEPVPPTMLQPIPPPTQAMVPTLRQQLHQPQAQQAIHQALRHHHRHRDHLVHPRHLRAETEDS